MNLPARTWACNFLFWILLGACSSGEILSTQDAAASEHALPELYDRYESLEQLQADINFPFLAADPATLPPGWALEEIDLQNADDRQVIVLTYSGNDRQLRLTQYPLSAPMTAPEVANEVVQIRNNTGYLITFPEMQNVNLIWNEAGLAVLLDCEYTAKELLVVAESLISFTTK